ncbi:MAG: M15 family metallopeptidase [Bacteroidota bacterium]|nr:M15 family metallopeptidase [Bacteroidota bacterium]
MKPPHGRKEIEEIFGNPATPAGKLSKVWKDSNIILAAPPAGWQLYYQDGSKLSPVKGISIHKLLVESFHEALSQIWNYAKNKIGGTPNDDDIRKWIHGLCLDQTNGGFDFRPITGGTLLSLHAYGIAIDWDAEHNPRKKPLTKTLPDWWYRIWADLGWSNGCHFPTPDPMHVQYATGAFMLNEE